MSERVLFPGWLERSYRDAEAGRGGGGAGGDESGRARGVLIHDVPPLREEQLRDGPAGISVHVLASGDGAAGGDDAPERPRGARGG